MSQRDESIWRDDESADVLWEPEKCPDTLPAGTVSASDARGRSDLSGSGKKADGPESSQQPSAAPVRDSRTKIADRLWAIEIVNRTHYDTDTQAFEAIKSMIFKLRREVETNVI